MPSTPVRSVLVTAGAAGLVALGVAPASATPTVGVRVAVRGAVTETLTGRVPEPKVILGYDKKHHLVGVHADLSLAGAHGGTATVTIRLFKKGAGWDGSIRISDPNASLDIRGGLHGAPVPHGKVVSWSGNGAVATGKIKLTWTV